MRVLDEAHVECERKIQMSEIRASIANWNENFTSKDGTFNESKYDLIQMRDEMANNW